MGAKRNRQSRKCAWCDREFMRGLNNHLRDVHGKTITEYVQHINGYKKCIYPGCELLANVDETNYTLNKGCCRSHSESVRVKALVDNGTHNWLTHIDESGNKVNWAIEAVKIGKHPSQNQKRDQNGKSIRAIKAIKTRMERGDDPFGTRVDKDGNRINLQIIRSRNGTHHLLKQNGGSEINRANARRRYLAGTLFSKKYSRFRSSKPELYMGDRLRSWNLTVLDQYTDPRWGHYYRADYFIPEFNIIIEVDGPRHYHGGVILCESDITRDSVIFDTSGIKTIRIKTDHVWGVSGSELISLFEILITSDQTCILV